MENLKIEKKEGYLLCKIGGELTLEVTPALKKIIDAEIEKGEEKIIVMDLSATSFVDSSGIGFLVALNTRVTRSGAKFYLFKPTAQVKKTLELVQLYNFFSVLKEDDDLDLLLPD